MPPRQAIATDLPARSARRGPRPRPGTRRRRSGPAGPGSGIGRARYRGWDHLRQLRTRHQASSSSSTSRNRTSTRARGGEPRRARGRASGVPCSPRASSGQERDPEAAFGEPSTPARSIRSTRSGRARTRPSAGRRHEPVDDRLRGGVAALFPGARRAGSASPADPARPPAIADVVSVSFPRRIARSTAGARSSGAAGGKHPRPTRWSRGRSRAQSAAPTLPSSSRAARWAGLVGSTDVEGTEASSRLLRGAGPGSSPQRSRGRTSTCRAQATWQRGWPWVTREARWA